MRAIFFFVIGAGLAVAASAAAVELRPIEVRKGTAGLEAAPLSVTNATSGPIVCTAEMAHWYSAELGQARPGARAEIRLWRDPSDGTFVALNASEDNLPIEKLWCGFEGRSYETRGEITLDRGAPAGSARSVTCEEQGGRLVCS